MPWRVEISRRGERDLEQLAAQDEAAIRDALRRLGNDPSAVDLRKLAGSSNAWRLRVGR
jgi:mRNA-degrading endonuclease RelE of RelBE toxin-antitoxin system